MFTLIFFLVCAYGAAVGVSNLEFQLISRILAAVLNSYVSGYRTN